MRVRGDLLIASFLLGHMDEVQKYVAYSGAGSLASEGLGFATARPLPACAPATDLSPDTMAIVEFSLTGDGRVTGVTPVFVSKGAGQARRGDDGGPESLFTQAVRRGSWKAVDAAKVSPFWRQVVRVELRCFTERPGGDPTSERFRADGRAWAALHGVTPLALSDDSSDAAALPAIVAEYERRQREFGPDSIQLLPAVAALGNNLAAADATRASAAQRQVELLQRYDAPRDVQLLARANAISLSPLSKDYAIDRRRQRQELGALLAESEASGISRMSLYLRLQRAALNDAMHETEVAKSLTDTIIAAPSSLLPADDPIRTAALLRRSSIAAGSNDTATAAATLAATGLAPEQCALVDVRPEAINAAMSATDFPNEARRWGTTGYLHLGYDITAEGRPVNVRTIIASPPFVFNQNTEKAVQRFRYRPVFRPGNTVGCSGQTQGVRFILSG